MKKTLMLLLCLVMMLSIFASCAESQEEASMGDSSISSGESSAKTESEESQEPITLTFWANDGSTQWMEVWEGTASHYMDKNPNVTIEVLGIPFEESAAKFNTAAATDTLPDLAHINPQNLSPMLAQDKVVDLQPYFDGYDEKDSISPGHISFFQNFLPDKPGLWSAPMFGSEWTIWCRLDWFEEIGIDLEYTKTWDWDDWFEVISELTTDDHYGFSLRGGEGNWHCSLNYLLSYTDSDSFFDENGVSFFRKDNAVEGLTKYVDICLNEEAPPTAVSNAMPEMIAEMANGNAAMAWHHLQTYTTLTEKIPEEDIGYGWLPMNSNGRRIKTDDAQGISMFTTCAEEKRDTAWDYIEFLWTSEEQLHIITLGGGTPSNSNTDVSSMPIVNDAIAQSSDPSTVVVNLPSYLTDWSAFTTQFLTPDLQACILGEMEPAEAIERWAEESERMYQEYYA